VIKDNIKANRHDNYLCQRSFHSTVSAWKNGHTDKHSILIAVPGAITWSVIDEETAAKNGEVYGEREGRI